MDMVDKTAETMPERIWATHMGRHARVSFGGYWSEPSDIAHTEYVLASTHTRALLALEEAEKALKPFAASPQLGQAIHAEKARLHQPDA
jgi:hypothetical protein